MMSKKFLGRMFICVVMLCLCWSIYSYAAKKTRDFTAPKTRETVEIDWKALYPFAEEEPHGKYFSLEESVIGKVYSYVKEHCEFYSSKRLVGYDQAIEAAKKYENIIGWNIAPVSGYNSVVKLHDGYLTVFTESKDVSLNAEAVIEFRDFCHNMSIDFCYMNFPSKVCVHEDSDISGTLDFSNQNTDRFLAMLDDAEVRNYDFRKYLHEDGMKHHESFFITDHHWKPETGLWAAKHILRILRDDYAYDVNPDMLNPENFDYVIYPEWFLGSHGKKVTLKQTKPEDISLIYPKFKTHLRFEIPVYNINTSGDLSITYSMNHIESRDYYGSNPYGAYKYADQPLTKIYNYDSKNEKKILFIHASMSNCVIPFTALAVRYTDEIDLRIFTGSLRSYIITNKPDLVIVNYSTKTPGITDNNPRFYDFR